MEILFNIDNCDTFALGSTISFIAWIILWINLVIYIRSQANHVGGASRTPSACSSCGLEDIMAANAPALHMDLHLWDPFIKYSREHVLDRAIDFLLRSLSLRSDKAEKELPHEILTRFPMGLRNAATTY
jgi:hypothetical protein